MTDFVTPVLLTYFPGDDVRHRTACKFLRLVLGMTLGSPHWDHIFSTLDLSSNFYTTHTTRYSTS